MQDWSLIDEYRKSHRRLVLLDYDGTLVSFDPNPELATPSKELLELLHKLQKSHETELVIVTGRTYQSIDLFLGQIPIDIIADHGAMIKENNSWKQSNAIDTAWKKSIYNVMTVHTELCPGSFIENKLFSLAWHYRVVDNGEIMAFGLVSELQKLRRKDIRIIVGNKVIEVVSSAIGKGRATEYILNRTRYDYVLSIGDDASDEEMFEALSNLDVSHTVKVGSGHTIAQHRINEVLDVHWLLNQLQNEV